MEYLIRLARSTWQVRVMYYNDSTVLIIVINKVTKLAKIDLQTQ